MSLTGSGLSGGELSGKKLYYSISEVARMTGVEQHVIRYWESEFPKLRPKKGRSGNRQFKEKDIHIVRYIKHLLHIEMYTIQGAKKRLSESGYKEVEGQLNLLSALPSVPTSQDSNQENKRELSEETKELLPDILQELQRVKKLLEN
jgi:DNA-binding transcriptional MerR regulator